MWGAPPYKHSSANAPIRKQTAGTPVQPGYAKAAWNQFLDVIMQKQVDIAIVFEPHIKSTFDIIIYKVFQWWVQAELSSIQKKKFNIEHYIWDSRW